MRTEEIRGQVIARTGFTTDARRCPIHDGALELTFDQTESQQVATGFPTVPALRDDNRVRWRCDACVGSYAENFFFRQPDFAPPSAHRLLLRCSRCGNRRVDHACAPECCEQHACSDCGSMFEARVELLEPGTLTPSSDGDPYLHPHRYPDLRMMVPGEPALRSGHRLAFRRCPNSEHVDALELVFIKLVDEVPDSQPPALCWYCAACQKSWTEACFHRQELGFIADAQPSVLCPQCQSSRIESDDEKARDECSAHCGDCGARLRVYLEYQPQ